MTLEIQWPLWKGNREPRFVNAHLLSIALRGMNFASSLYDSESGAYRQNRTATPDIWATQWAVTIAYLAGRLEEIETESITEYVLGLHNRDGGFSMVSPGGQSSSRNTFCAVAVLSLLERPSTMDTDRVIGYLESLRLDDGGYCFSSVIIPKPDLLSTFYTLSSLDNLGVTTKEDFDTKQFLISLQQEDGSFSGKMFGSPDIEDTFFALASLDLSGSLDSVNLEMSYQYLTSRFSEKLLLTDIAWSVMALDILNREFNSQPIAEQLQQMQRDEGAFGLDDEMSLGYTYYALQALYCLNGIG